MSRTPPAPIAALSARLSNSVVEQILHRHRQHAQQLRHVPRPSARNFAPKAEQRRELAERRRVDVGRRELVERLEESGELAESRDERRPALGVARRVLRIASARASPTSRRQRASRAVAEPQTPTTLGVDRTASRERRARARPPAAASRRRADSGARNPGANSIARDCPPIVVRALEHEHASARPCASAAAATSPFAPAPMTIASKRASSRLVARGSRAPPAGPTRP